MNPNQYSNVIMFPVRKQERDVPTILTQDKAHPARSEKYSLVKTMDVIKHFEDAGFTWKLESAERCRGHYAGYGTHLVSLEHPDVNFNNPILDREIKPRLYLKNSYHGRSKLMLDLGLFRFYCENGLFIGMMLQSFRKKHIGIGPEDIERVVTEMRKSYSEVVVPIIGGLMEVEMTEGQQIAFAKSALAQRLSTHKSYIGGEYEKLLTIQRPEDNNNTAWTILNRVQENLGLNFRPSPVDVNYKYMTEDKDGNSLIKERKVSKLTRLDEVSRLNKFLFDDISNHVPALNKKLMIAA